MEERRVAKGDTVWLAGKQLNEAHAGPVLMTSDLRVPQLPPTALNGREALDVVGHIGRMPAVTASAPTGPDTGSSSGPAGPAAGAALAARAQSRAWPPGSGSPTGARAVSSAGDGSGARPTRALPRPQQLPGERGPGLPRRGPVHRRGAAPHWSRGRTASCPGCGRPPAAPGGEGPALPRREALRGCRAATPSSGGVPGPPSGAPLPKTLVLRCDAGMAEGDAAGAASDVLVTEGFGAPAWCLPLPEHAASNRQASSEVR